MATLAAPLIMAAGRPRSAMFAKDCAKAFGVRPGLPALLDDVGRQQCESGSKLRAVQTLARVRAHHCIAEARSQKSVFATRHQRRRFIGRTAATLEKAICKSGDKLHNCTMLPRRLSARLDHLDAGLLKIIHVLVGQTWESFVIETLIAAAPDGTEAHYYRTATGVEVDLLLTLPGGKLWAIEIKRSSAPSMERGFHLACAGLKPNKRFVVYSGTERFPLDADTDAIGVGDLGRALQAAK